MSKNKVYGNPVKFAEDVFEQARTRFMNELKDELEKAYSSSLSLVDSALEVCLRRGIGIITERYHNVTDELRSYEVSLDRALKLEKQELEGKYVEKVLDTVYGMLLKLSKEEKITLYGPILSSLKEKLAEGNYIVYVNPKEKEIIDGILGSSSHGKKFEIINEFTIDSGFILTDENNTIFYDYTLRTMYESIKPYLMTKARAILFGR